MVFIDLRDHDGVTQLKFNPEADPEAHKVARDLRHEDVVAIEGTVRPRGENVNPKLPTGEIEVDVHVIDLLAKADTPPFEVSDHVDANEDRRLRYRVVDLRRQSNQRIFRMRHKLGKTIRDFFDTEGFIEIETPFLTKSTPEGARDYLVPSRVQPGTFFALPQSPQIFKQLFMMAGFDRYCQIVRCFRDEDLRADRQPEFTQVDMEMAFVERDDVMTVVEGCVKAMFKAALDIEVPTPFPRITYAESMNRFGTDRPDTRYGMELHDITDVVRDTDFSVFKSAIASGGVVKCLVAKGGETLTRRITDGLTDELKGIGGGGLPMTKVLSGDTGPEFSTGIAKFMTPYLAKLCEQTGASAGDAIFFMPGPFDEVCKYLDFTRQRLAEIMNIIPEDQWNLLWVIDFPLFIWDEDEQRHFSTHHPFTAPVDEDMHMLESDPLKVRDKAYDLVLNGTEMAGGSIRIHNRDTQRRVFKVLGLTEQEAHEKFEFLMDGLRFGAPPHGGIAFGFDRWVMLLSKSESLRDVIAFPKTQRAVCPLTQAPSRVDEKQLTELGIDLRPETRARFEEGQK
jgi:aspartyl-tRNA synthetase